MNLKIEYVNSALLWEDEQSMPDRLTVLGVVPVVRLEQVDAVIAKAEMFAAKTLAMYRPAGLDEGSNMMAEAKAFLASTIVDEWRTRQEERKS